MLPFFIHVGRKAASAAREASMLRKIVTAAALGIMALQLTGCVGMGKYELMEQKAQVLDRDLASLQQKHKDLAAENAGLKGDVEKLKKDLADTSSERERALSDNRKLDEVLKAKSDTLSKNIAELRRNVSDLESQNAGLRKDVEALQKAKEEKVREVSRTYDDLLKKMEGEISRGQVTISELRGKLTVNMVDAILFDSGKAEVKPEGLAVLQKVIDILKDVKDKAIRIEGHTDNVHIVGNLTKKYPTNWELSAARAVNVARFLQQQGIDPALVAAVGYGEFKPVASNDTEEGKAKNRRIEIILVPKD
jgi:chemotaxis protein MotB